MEECKYPHVKVRVKLNGKDGNEFTVLDTIQREMKRHKVPAEDIGKFFAEAISSDYENFVKTCRKWVSIG